MSAEVATAASAIPVGENSAPPCADCGKPAALCVCAALTVTDNRIAVVILRHPREARQDLASAWLAHRQLVNSAVVTGLSWPSLKAILGRPVDRAHWGVLHLGRAGHAGRLAKAAVTVVDKKGEPLADQAKLLAQLDGIVVLDGNWAQAKTLWWRNPWLLKLRRLVIDPQFRSLYGDLRREPRRQAISTLEAIGFCLGELEGDPALLERLARPLQLLLGKYRSRRDADRAPTPVQPAA